MLEAGEGTVETIDDAALGAGYAMGPLASVDGVGLDTDLDIDRALCDAFRSTDRFEPPALQVRLVAEGRTGRAAGRGFYRYQGDLAQPDVSVAFRAPLAPDAIVERLELGMVNEAYRVVEDGIAGPPDIDTVMRDAGFPRAPFEIVDRLGLRVIIDRLRRLEADTAERSGEQYAVATLLWQMATV